MNERGLFVQSVGSVLAIRKNVL